VELRRFWMMIAHYHGQLVNYSELGRSFNAADTTVRRYLDVLSSTFMVRQLPPWFENLKNDRFKFPNSTSGIRAFSIA
jgi:predicted AAA+ superfamily ATPase